MNCPICLEGVRKDDEMWMCYKCEVVIHLRCMPTRSSGSIRTINGCPTCRFTEQEAVLEAERLQVPPLGIWCSGCWKWVKWHHKVVKCPAPSDMCLGHMHAVCFRGICGACGLSTREALREMRDRKLELFRTKM